MIAMIMLISTMAISCTLAGIVAEIVNTQRAVTRVLSRVVTFNYCGIKDRKWSYADSHGPIVARVIRQFQNGVAA